MSASIELQLKNSLAEVQRLGRAIGGFCEAQKVTAKLSHRITLALEELVTNTVSYGYRGNREQDIDVVVEITGACLRITVEDDAWPFDPRQNMQPALDGALEERQIGGLGLHLIENLSDEIEYQQADGRNRTTLVFMI